MVNSFKKYTLFVLVLLACFYGKSIDFQLIDQSTSQTNSTILGQSTFDFQKVIFNKGNDDHSNRRQLTLYEKQESKDDLDIESENLHHKFFATITNLDLLGCELCKTDIRLLIPSQLFEIIEQRYILFEVFRL